MQLTYESQTETPIVGGYRLVRILGEGAKARVHLGFTEGDEVAAVKVFDARSSTRHMDVEAEALSLGRHPHVVSLIDIARNSLILERLAWGSLATLLASRAFLHDGEIATILAPLGAALDSLHDNGVAHNAIRTSAVLFRADGSPVLACFGAATLERARLTIAAQEHVQPFVDDRKSFLALASLVMSKATGHSAVTSAHEFVRLALDSGCPDPVGLALAERLFRATVPSAISFSDDAASATPPIASRVVPAIGGEAPVVYKRDRGKARAASRGRRRREPWAAATAESLDVSPLHRARAFVASRLASTRRRAVALFLVVVVGAVLVAAVVPTAAASDGSQPTSPVPAVSTPGPSAEAAVRVLPGDPLEALPLLLDARERCFVELSVDCLANVHQPGSAAMADDAELIRAIVEGGEVGNHSVTLDAPRLAELLGDSAIIVPRTTSKKQPAPILLMKVEAGWRIRSLGID